MGTKNNPGQFDCYANAGPDEPMFVLLGRDRHAPLLVRLWAILRHEEGEDPGKIREAFQCAGEMEKELRRRKKTLGGGEELLELATTSLSDHPDDYDGPCNCSECRSYQ
ncbi:hypothetical protein [Hoeflea sp.]|uniref:hypothetical protein n=1 Tax=Hoeflea sp. TaxID=1940281 RepID=UPI00198DC3A5|nr:hypothetical protein [Hoeflea sp.]MBC7282652.1 hypothetical protein [Hoeflea sp.]